jgi:hypothetical protein
VFEYFASGISLPEGYAACEIPKPAEKFSGVLEMSNFFEEEKKCLY